MKKSWRSVRQISHFTRRNAAAWYCHSCGKLNPPEAELQCITCGRDPTWTGFAHAGTTRPLHLVNDLKALRKEQLVPFLEAEAELEQQGAADFDEEAETQGEKLEPWEEMLKDAGVGGAINAVDDGGWTPLHCAAAAGNGAVVSALLGRGALIAARTRAGGGMTALHLAAERGHAGVVRALVAGGAAISAPTLGEEQTALHLAARGDHTECVGLLLNASADLNARNVLGGTPLHSAAEGNAVGALKQLLDAGCDPKLLDHDGWTAQQTADFHDYDEFTEYMINASLGIKQLRSEVPPPPWAGTLWESCKDEREKGQRRIARQREVDALWESEKRWWRNLKETNALARWRGQPLHPTAGIGAGGDVNVMAGSQDIIDALEAVPPRDIMIRPPDEEEEQEEEEEQQQDDGDGAAGSTVATVIHDDDATADTRGSGGTPIAGLTLDARLMLPPDGEADADDEQRRLDLAAALPASPPGGASRRTSCASRMTTARRSLDSVASRTSTRSRRSQPEMRVTSSGSHLLDTYLQYRDGPDADRAVTPYHRYIQSPRTAGSMPTSATPAMRRASLVALGQSGLFAP